MRKILCVAAHPDDEVLGCGASLAKHAVAGDHVEVIIAAEGLASRNDQVKESEFQKLFEMAEKANHHLGVKKVHFLRFPDNQMDSVSLLTVVKKIEEIISRLKPETVYTHCIGDLNVDHQIVNKAVVTACRPQPGFSVKQLLAFEVPSATHWNPGDETRHFEPNYFVNVETCIEKKIESLNIYESEMRTFPHARSIQAVNALAVWRGSLVGCAAAEAFQLLRAIND